MIFDDQLSEDLWNGEKSIGLFIHKRKFYWVIDYKYNFSLDADKEYSAYLSKGRITRNQYIAACKEFRAGILVLTENNFQDYLNIETTNLVSKEDLKEYFHSSVLIENCERLFRHVENTLLFDDEIPSRDFKLINEILSKLPLFCINFDRKIFLHRDWDRCHESLVSDGWKGYSEDFLWCVPSSEVYWEVEGFDFWKVTRI
ncbi:hypothetical protein [Marinibactrum halimedae]|uniref:Uncharacterized protein n=1 Tax=Marinibactrum halimedae TaxID=1444977 RepID=A0AA37WMB0_9GAMM|nr:hypothetical protein [Marinibactrum halimedae]MCD9460998.1 hypothetical protein [Marinibactrum halimedae]GLS24771.1 hypothetical protein GCM10007877_04850 [Marinibactrum halimedae]